MRSLRGHAMRYALAIAVVSPPSRWPAQAVPARRRGGDAAARRRSVRSRSPTGDHAGFESIFDGSSMKDWDGDPAFWRVDERRADRPEHDRESGQAEHLPHLARRRAEGLRAEGRVPAQRDQQRHPDPQRAAAGRPRHRQVGDEGLSGGHRRREPVHRPDLRGARPRISRDARPGDATSPTAARRASSATCSRRPTS